MCWFFHGSAIIIRSLSDDIRTKDPKAEIIALCNQAFNSQTLFQVYFLEDVLSMTNVLSL